MGTFLKMTKMDIFHMGLFPNTTFKFTEQEYVKSNLHGSKYAR